MNRFLALTLSCVGLMSLSFAAVAAAEDQPMPAAPPAMEQPKADQSGVIKPEDAKDNEGKTVTVEFTVAAARESSSGVCFLNSSSDRNDPAGFTAFINSSTLKKMKDEMKNDHPDEYFKDKKIHVSGKIEKYNDKWEIKVTSPSQIKVVEGESKPAEEKKE